MKILELAHTALSEGKIITKRWVDRGRPRV
jgi:hypothetical protein